jgi:hypothetical protein
VAAVAEDGLRVVDVWESAAALGVRGQLMPVVKQGIMAEPKVTVLPVRFASRLALMVRQRGERARGRNSRGVAGKNRRRLVPGNLRHSARTCKRQSPEGNIDGCEARCPVCDQNARRCVTGLRMGPERMPRQDHAAMAPPGEGV